MTIETGILIMTIIIQRLIGTVTSKMSLKTEEKPQNVKSYFCLEDIFPRVSNFKN